jgi:hypothetical protein
VQSTARIFTDMCVCIVSRGEKKKPTHSVQVCTGNGPSNIYMPDIQHSNLQQPSFSHAHQSMDSPHPLHSRYSQPQQSQRSQKSTI